MSKHNQLGQDIIEMYKPYRNHNAKWKVTTISKQKFEIYDRYEIIDVSKYAFIKLDKEPMALLLLLKTRKQKLKEKILLQLKKLTKLLSIRSSPKELWGS